MDSNHLGARHKAQARDFSKQGVKKCTQYLKNGSRFWSSSGHKNKKQNQEKREKGQQELQGLT